MHFVTRRFIQKIYTRTNSFGIKNKGDFDLAFRVYKMGRNRNQTKIESYFGGKNPTTYLKREEVNINEQKPIKIEDDDQKKWILKQKPKPKLPTVRVK